MKRRDFVKTVGGCVVALTAPGCARRKNTPEPPPQNIILIVTDDQRHDALGCAGNSIIHTPVMDDLAASGTRFEYAFVTTPICAASRASIFTGLFAFRSVSGRLMQTMVPPSSISGPKHAKNYTGM
jgi:hypothetical protein